MNLKILILAAMFCWSIFLPLRSAWAGLDDKHRIVGTYDGTSNNMIKLKTAMNTLLVPKKLFSRKSKFLLHEVIEINVTMAELNQIKAKQ